ncbi:hypothetical protein B0H11DRAFT_1951864 [Mycena galericulata]|nr:hypothetical protein B0H11DRAFT_1951864 [Mycena galericulata]
MKQTQTNSVPPTLSSWLLLLCALSKLCPAISENIFYHSYMSLPAPPVPGSLDLYSAGWPTTSVVPLARSPRAPSLRFLPRLAPIFARKMTNMKPLFLSRRCDLLPSADHSPNVRNFCSSTSHLSPTLSSNGSFISEFIALPDPATSSILVRLPRAYAQSIRMGNPQSTASPEF